MRLYGYEHILHADEGHDHAGRAARSGSSSTASRETLVGMGFYEALNYLFIAPDWLKAMDYAAGDWRLDPLPVRNPLGEDTSVMRTTLVPSMLHVLSTNLELRQRRRKVCSLLSTVFKKTEPMRCRRKCRSCPWACTGRTSILRPQGRGHLPDALWHRRGG